MSIKNKPTDLYTKLHKFSLLAILGVSAVTTGLFIYNVYLFKTGKNLIIILFRFRLVL